MTNLWSGRFAGAPDAAAFEFGSSFRFDRRLFEDDVTGSIAWARAIARAGVLEPDAGRRLHTGRSRNEQVSLDLRLYMLRRIPALQIAIAALVDALARQAASAG